MNSIKFEQYEKISDTVYFLGQGVVLKFFVQLGSKGQDGKKYSLHNEYMYKNNKYNDIDNSISIKRTFDYYLAIETLGNNREDKEFIMIYPKDMIYLKMCLNTAFSWFTDDKFKGLYKYKGTNLVMCGKVEPVTVKGLVMDKFISFEPTVCHFDNAEDKIGVRITLSKTYIDVTVDILAGLVYKINEFNMYLSAQNMINYLQRPITYGYNLNDLSKDYNNESYLEGFIESNTNRQIKSKKTQKSFFSRVDEI